MTAVAARRTSLADPLVRFVRTPKGLLLPILGLLALAGVSAAGAAGLTSVAVGVGTAAAVEMAISGLARDVWKFPSAAILSGIFVAVVLAPQEPLLIVAVTAGLSIVGKQYFRSRGANIFNPAALALAVSAIVFSSAQSWWGALPDLGVIGVALVVAAGLFVANHVNKLPVVLAFLAIYFGLFTLASVMGDPAKVAEVFRAPDVNAALFFAFFMLDDPPTCPVRYGDQVIFAGIVACVSYGVFMLFGVVYFLLAGLLIGNLWEGMRRSLQARSRGR